MEPFKPEYENLYRGLPGGVQLHTEARDDGEGDTGGGGDIAAPDTTIVGHFAVFNDWTEISSWYEGEFLERLLPGSFKNTFKEHIGRVKVQFDHGQDEYIGGKPLGPIDVLREDDTGAYYEVPLLDTDYNHDQILPMLQGRLMSGEKVGSVLGASFRFRVVKDTWNMEPKSSAYNPKALPERTISQVTLFEFGPVVFPSYPSATAAAGTGMRSLTDYYLDRRRSTRSAGHHTAPAVGLTATPGSNPNESPSALGGQTATTSARKSALRALALADL